MGDSKVAVGLVLTLLLAESSIELIPREIVSHPAVLKRAHRKKKNPGQLILDQNYHYAAMKKLVQNRERGRPDIAHLCLLAALGAPLNLENHLRCIVHTRDDKAIRVNPKTRLPRNTDRFVALLEQLYELGVVPQEGDPLLTLETATMPRLVSELSPGSVIALTTTGTPTPMFRVAERLVSQRNPVLLVGGFPVGHFSEQTRRLAGEAYRIDKNGLDAWTVVARAVYDYERALASQA